MNFSLQVSLLVVILVLIVGLVLLQGTGRHRKRKRGWGIRKRMDYGAHTARRHGHKRSSQWAKVAKEHRLREPACVVCGYKGKWVQVHHIKPFHLHPHLELEPSNLITLCEAKGKDHHLLLGHLDEWESYNEHIRHDARHFAHKTAALTQTGRRR